MSGTINNSLGKNFAAIFPPELSNVLFSYLSDSDLFSASQCCILWRNTINNDQQWAKRCLQKGWTTDITLNEPHLWEDLSHVAISNRRRLRPTPAFNLNHHLGFEPDDRLYALCDWAMYYRQRLHILKNWRKGNYVIHQLVAPEAKTDHLIINDSAYNGKYLVIGTTTGYVFIWNVAGVPRIVTKIKPVFSNEEVQKVAITSKGCLVVVYEGAFIHVYEEKDCGSGEDDTTFKLKALGRIFLKICDSRPPTLHYDLLSSDIDERELDNEKYLQMLATGTESVIPLVEDILYSLHGETILISCEGETSYILWDLKDDKLNYQIQRLPVLHKITQILIDADLLMFAIEREEPTGNHYAIMLCKAVEFNNSMKITPTVELAVPTFIDEMLCDQSMKERRLAICSHDGIVGAFCITSKRLIFLNNTGSAVNNLTICKEFILYQESTDYNIVALSWLGAFTYKITGHIGPIREIRCINQFIVSGGAARELMVWDKTSGEIAHRVYHQPSHIVNLYVSPTCILTVGKDDPPVLIGYV